jgi:DNA-binding NarL/FixJ family response regulator
MPRILLADDHALVRAGAAGYVLKNASVTELEQAIHTVMRGEKYLTPVILNELRDDEAKQWRRGHHPSDPDAALRDSLTTRQREVLQLLAEGNSTRDIAARLNLSVKTIETHRAHLMPRLGVRDLAGLVRAAIRLGLTALEK